MWVLRRPSSCLSSLHVCCHRVCPHSFRAAKNTSPLRRRDDVLFFVFSLEIKRLEAKHVFQISALGCLTWCLWSSMVKDVIDWYQDISLFIDGRTTDLNHPNLISSISYRTGWTMYSDWRGWWEWTGSVAKARTAEDAGWSKPQHVSTNWIRLRTSCSFLHFFASRFLSPC